MLPIVFSRRAFLAHLPAASPRAAVGRLPQVTIADHARRAATWHPLPNGCRRVLAPGSGEGFVLSPSLYQGASGTVCLARMLTAGTQVLRPPRTWVAKIVFTRPSELQKRAGTQVMPAARCLQEAELTERLAPWSLTPGGVFETEDAAITLLPAFAGGADQALAGLRQLPATTAQRRDFVRHLAARVAAHLQYIHQQQRGIHGDVKPANIMWKQDGDISLGDFGYSRPIPTTSRPVARRGSPLYMAPELVIKRRQLTQSDMYSLGIALCDMLVAQKGRNPLEGRINALCKARERARNRGMTAARAEGPFIEGFKRQVFGDIHFTRLAIMPGGTLCRIRLAQHPGPLAAFWREVDAVDPDLFALVLEHLLVCDPLQRAQAKDILPQLLALAPSPAGVAALCHRIAGLDTRRRDVKQTLDELSLDSMSGSMDE